MPRRAVDDLKREARDRARVKGHKLGRFQPVHGVSKVAFFANCQRCGAGVVADTLPLRQDLAISGLAVQNRCGDEPSRPH